MATSRIFNRITQELLLPVSAANNIAQGDMCYMTVHGVVTNAVLAVASTLQPRFVGLAKGDANNASGASSAINVTVVQGTWEASGTSSPTAKDIGKTAFAGSVTGSITTASGSTGVKLGVIEQLGTRSLYVFVNDGMNTKLAQDE